ncbi:Neutral ceramidase [Phytophthora cinnamomi]|uniref:Neutral ceramidase n=1 Tax=Phytophthora cinnamomi TaxID=4785 RepID=UPI00355985AE|nr:Neutral ceramidase [Phytophthora cinnamomi]
MRQRFGPSQDYLLAVQVNTDQPFRAPYGGLMAGWEKVATTLNGCSAFKMHHLKGPIAKNRFERLVARHRDWVKSGSRPESAPSEDASFQSVMTELIPKLDAAEADPPSQNLGKRGRPRKIRPDDTLAGKKPALLASQVAIAPSPLGPQPPSSSTSLLVDSEDQALPIVTKATRQRFTPNDDLLLVKYVKESLPFRAKFGAISSAWEDVANKLDNSPDFSKDNIKGPIVRYRFENLVSKYRERVKRNNGRVVGPKGAPAERGDRHWSG